MPSACWHEINQNASLEGNDKPEVSIWNRSSSATRDLETPNCAAVDRYMDKTNGRVPYQWIPDLVNGRSCIRAREVDVVVSGLGRKINLLKPLEVVHIHLTVILDPKQEALSYIAANWSNWYGCNVGLSTSGFTIPFSDRYSCLTVSTTPAIA